MELINHPEAFRAYLESIEEPIAECVGFRHDPLGCPIANWLSDTFHHVFGVDAEDIHEVCTYSDDPLHRFATPLWIRGFVWLVDSEASDGTVSKEEALAALNEAERQAAQLLLPEKCESLIRCCHDGCDEVGKVWITVYAEREETFHLCWDHFTKRFPRQSECLPEPVPA